MLKRKFQKLITRWTSERYRYYLSKLRRSLSGFIISLACNRVRACMIRECILLQVSSLSTVISSGRRRQTCLSLVSSPLSHYTEHFAVWPQPAKQMRSSLQTNILREFWTVDYFYWHDNSRVDAWHSRKHARVTMHRRGCITREGNPSTREYTASAGFLRDYAKQCGGIPRDVLKCARIQSGT